MSVCVCVKNIITKKVFFCHHCNQSENIIYFINVEGEDSSNAAKHGEKKENGTMPKHFHVRIQKLLRIHQFEATGNIVQIALIYSFQFIKESIEIPINLENFILNSIV